ncbi:MAG TPA: multidrug effflux MFS transporter [Chryseolinea sp.]|nr:multidrug effflux MFS transporter [Chryseolinea sp.]
MKRKSNFFVILILGALATISPLSIDMYLPGFPALANDLNTTIDQVQLSLTSYFIGIAIGQLIYGPLLDRFGRRKPLYVGLSLYIIASIGCAFTTSVDTLIAARFIQALGGCGGMVAAQALVRDLFPVNKTAQAFSLIMLVIAVSPMIAPTIGGYVTASFGWNGVFIILAFTTAVIMAAVYFFLNGGKEADPSLSLKPRAVISGFRMVIKQPQFMIYTLAGGLGTAAPFAYIAGSPDVFMNIYGVTEQQYGWIFALLASAMIGSTQLNHILLKHFKNEELVKVAFLYQGVIGILLVGGTLYGGWGLYSLLILMFIFLSGQGLIGPNATALSLAPFSKHAGSAAALLGSWRMSIGAIVSALVSVLHNNTALPMVGMMAACAWASLIMLLICNAIVRKRASPENTEEAPAAL